MVKIPPLSPSFVWWQRWLKAFIETEDSSQAIAAANIGMGNKEFNRIILPDQNGEELILSLPIQGGAKTLKSSTNLKDLLLSDHGDWRRNHLKTFEACLGKKPLFRHFSSGIDAIYSNRELNTLEDFNSAIFRQLSAFILENISLEEFRQYSSSEIIKKRGKEVLEQINPRISAIHAFSSLGKEAIPGLIVWR